MQDFTGVPAVVDLAAMRDAMADIGGDASKINPLVPAELVIDHSVQVDAFGTRDAFRINAEREFERNEERYAFLRWGQDAFDNFAVVPPDTGIVHQVNLEYLARVVFTSDETAHEGPKQAYPDTLVGTDSHTTMINGLGVLGWGVGGIEAEAAMLGQPMSMLIPQVVGFKLSGELPEGATATDLVLTVTQMLRERGVVGKFVEFFGPGRGGAAAGRPGDDRQHVAGVRLDLRDLPDRRGDAALPRVLRAARRSGSSWSRRTPRSRACGTTPTPRSRRSPTRSSSTSRRSCRRSPGPKRPQDRVSLTESKAAFRLALEDLLPDEAEDPKEGEPDPDEASADSFPSSDPPVVGRPQRPRRARAAADRAADGGTGGLQVAERTEVTVAGHARGRHRDRARPRPRRDRRDHVVHQHLEPVGHARRRACSRATPCEKGLKSKPWVKTSLAPGSKVVTEYLERAGLTDDLEALGFHLVGYGCTTCIGNSGPLPEEISDVVQAEDLAVVSVLSGNRNFEGRINPDVKMNYLASPPLCVAYALAGTMDIDLLDEPLGQDEDGKDVFLKDIWPSEQEIAETVESAVQSDMFRKSYGEVFDGDERWNSLEVPDGDRFAWAEDSTYVRQPPFFEDFPPEPEAVTDIEGARVLAVLGDSVTTDHISPAGAIKEELAGRRVPQGARRRAQGLQLLRLAPRQPRGDGARHVRQHPPAQPARAGHRGRGHDASSRTARR